MKRALTLLVLIALGVTTATANATGVTIRGSRSCGTWIKERDPNAGGLGDTVSMTWLVGYLSGVASSTGKDFIAGTDNASIALWVDNYCKANPLEYLDDAGDKLAKELIRKKRP